MRESALEAHFVRRITAAGGLCWKLVPVVAGIPDRIVLMPGGVTLYVELKTETGVLSPIQKHRHEQMRALGFHVYTLYGKQQVDDWVDCLH